MRRVAAICAAVLLIFSVNAYTQIFSTPTILDQPTEKSDPLKRVYSELKVGMKLNEVRDLAEKYHPKLKLEDTDIWGPHEFLDHPGDPTFSLVFGIEPKMVPIMGRKDRARVHKITLRLDFDEKMKLINAVYVRYGKKFKDGNSKFEERKALVGNGYY